MMLTTVTKIVTALSLIIKACIGGSNQCNTTTSLNFVAECSLICKSVEKLYQSQVEVELIGTGSAEKSLSLQNATLLVQWVTFSLSLGKKSKRLSLAHFHTFINLHVCDKIKMVKMAASSCSCINVLAPCWRYNTLCNRAIRHWTGGNCAVWYACLNRVTLLKYNVII